MALKDNYYTVQEVAEILAVTRQTIYRWIKNETIDAEVIGRETLIEKSEVIRYKEDMINDWLTQGYNSKIERQNYKVFRDMFHLDEKDKIERMGDKRVLNYVVYRENEEAKVICIWRLGTTFNKKTSQLETDILPEDVTIETISEFEKKVKKANKKKR
jgi:excisionase family DNA binding protein